MPNSCNSTLPLLQRILVIGSGGREDYLAWSLSKCKGVEKVLVAPGNGGTQNHLNCFRLAIEERNSDELIKACKANQIDLVVIGPEAPLAAGVADKLRQADLAVFGWHPPPTPPHRRPLPGAQLPPPGRMGR